MDPRLVILIGIAAGFAFSVAIGVWRRGFQYGILCGIATIAVMATIAIPLYLAFEGCRRLT